MSKTHIKICCISSAQDVEIAVNAGVDALGFVSQMPSGPGVIDWSLIPQLIASLPDHIDSFLLTKSTSTNELVEQAINTGATTLQLVDEVELETLKALKQALPTHNIVQVVHVMDEHAIDYAHEVAEVVDMVLLDSGNPNQNVLGGTGKVHDWSISAQICEQLDVPVYLAGGLAPHNIRDAIETVAPFGVDICSGVRTNDVLDAEKLTHFVQKVRAS